MNLYKKINFMQSTLGYEQIQTSALCRIAENLDILAAKANAESVPADELEDLKQELSEAYSDLEGCMERYRELNRKHNSLVGTNGANVKKLKQEEAAHAYTKDRLQSVIDENKATHQRAKMHYDENERLKEQLNQCVHEKIHLRETVDKYRAEINQYKAFEQTIEGKDAKQLQALMVEQATLNDKLEKEIKEAQDAKKEAMDEARKYARRVEQNAREEIAKYRQEAEDMDGLRQSAESARQEAQTNYMNLLEELENILSNLDPETKRHFDGIL